MLISDHLFHVENKESDEAAKKRVVEEKDESDSEDDEVWEKMDKIKEEENSNTLKQNTNKKTKRWKK